MIRRRYVTTRASVCGLVSTVAQPKKIRRPLGLSSKSFPARQKQQKQIAQEQRSTQHQAQRVTQTRGTPFFNSSAYSIR